MKRRAMLAALAVATAAAAAVAGPAGAASRQDGAGMPVLGLDLYRSSQIDLTRLEREVGHDVRSLAGAMFDPGTDAEDLEERYRKLLQRISALGDFAFVGLSPIQYEGADGPYVYVTVDVVDAADREVRIRFLDAPAGPPTADEGIVEAWQRYEGRTWERLSAGAIRLSEQVTCPVPHCLFGIEDEQLAPLFDDLRQRAPGARQAIAATLRGDADPKRRAAAAFLAGMVDDPEWLVTVLVPAIRDPDSLVRNNAMRVLAQLAMAGRAASVPLEEVLAAIDFPETTDRNKALALLAGLAADPATQGAIRQRGGHTLLRLLELSQPNNRDWALRVLQAVSGHDWGPERLDEWRRWVESPGV